MRIKASSPVLWTILRCVSGIRVSLFAASSFHIFDVSSLFFPDAMIEGWVFQGLFVHIILMEAWPTAVAAMRPRSTPTRPRAPIKLTVF